MPGLDYQANTLDRIRRNWQAIKAGALSLDLLSGTIPALPYIASSTDLTTTAPLSGGGLLSTGLTLVLPVASSTANGYLSSTDYLTIKTREFGYTVDGGGSTITLGSKGYRRVEVAGTITGYVALADQSGSVTMDLRKCAYAGFPTTTSIVASDPISISAAQKNQDTTLTGWTTAFSAGDIFEFVVSTAATITRLQIFLTYVAN